MEDLLEKLLEAVELGKVDIRISLPSTIKRV